MSQRNGSANAVSSVRPVTRLVTVEGQHRLLIAYSAHLLTKVALRDMIQLRSIKSLKSLIGWCQRLTSPLPTQKARALHRKTNPRAIILMQTAPSLSHQHPRCQCASPSRNSSTATPPPQLRSRAHHPLHTARTPSQKASIKAAHGSRRRPSHPSTLSLLPSALSPFSLRLAPSTAPLLLPSIGPPAPNGVPKKNSASSR